MNCSQLVTKTGRLFAVSPFYFYPRKAKLDVYGYMLQPRMPWLRLLSLKKGYNALSITSIQLEDQRYKPSSLLSTPVLPWHCPSGISPLWSAIRHTLHRATPLASVQALFSPRRIWTMMNSSHFSKGMKNWTHALETTNLSLPFCTYFKANENLYSLPQVFSMVDPSLQASKCWMCNKESYTYN